MDDKKLPIRYFSMRDKDERMTECSGDSEIPNWVDKEAIPQKQLSFSNVLSETAIKLSTKAKNKYFLPSLLTLHINHNALAKGHRENVASIFNDRGAINLIGVFGNDKVLIKVNNKDEANRIGKKITNLKFGDRTYLGTAAIDQIDEFMPVIEDNLNPSSILKIKLVNYYDRQLNELLINMFEKECNENHILYSRCKYSNQLIAYRGQNITTDQLKFLKGFEGVQSISNMPVLEFSEDSIQYSEDVAIKIPRDGIQYPIVGVLDSGIEKIPHLLPWRSEEHTSDSSH